MQNSLTSDTAEGRVLPDSAMNFVAKHLQLATSHARVAATTVDRKFTPLFPRTPFCSRVAPSRLSISVPNIAAAAHFVPLPSLADDDLSYEALRQAARRGRLEAHQGSDGIWRASRSAVQAYKQRRYQREA